MGEFDPHVDPEATQAPASPPPAQPSWLLMVTQLPTDDPGSRMRVLRTLESLGAAVMREGVFLLPTTPGNRRSLESLGDYIARIGGTANVMQVDAVSAMQRSAMMRLFDR